MPKCACGFQLPVGSYLCGSCAQESASAAFSAGPKTRRDTYESIRKSMTAMLTGLYSDKKYDFKVEARQNKENPRQIDISYRLPIEFIQVQFDLSKPESDV